MAAPRMPRYVVNTGCELACKDWTRIARVLEKAPGVRHSVFSLGVPEHLRVRMNLEIEI